MSICLLGFISSISSDTPKEETKIEQDCPIIDAYFGGNINTIDNSKDPYYECLYRGMLNDPGWYDIKEDGKFVRMNSADSPYLTQWWIEEGFKIKGKEELIRSEGLNFIEFSNETIKLKFVQYNAFFELYGNTFTNINAAGTQSYYAFIEFDYKNEEIIGANFMVDRRGGNYKFGDDNFNIPPYSRVLFNKETGIQIEIDEEANLTNFLDLFKFNGKYPTTIEGKNIPFPNGINLINGKININEKGYILENGNALYKQNSLVVNDENNEILIANENTDLSNYEGNWIKQTSKDLKIQSSKDGQINIEFLENHEILNTDNKDKISAQIKNGDGIKIETRNNLGLIPSIKHESSENGETTIQNDKFEFAINKDGFTMRPPSLLEDTDYSKKYQSVASEIESDSLNTNTKLRINSYRQFEILSKDNEELITYNKNGLPISAKLEDNELQTINQLKEKYPKVKFEISEDSSFNDENMPPSLIHSANNFFNSDSEDIKNFDKIKFTDIGETRINESTLIVGLEDNELQTIEQLRDKYSEVKFEEYKEEESTSASESISNREYLSTLSYTGSILGSILDREDLITISENINIIKNDYNIDVRFIAVDSIDSTTGESLNSFGKEKLGSGAMSNWNLLVFYNYKKNTLRLIGQSKHSNMGYENLEEIEIKNFVKYVLEKNNPSDEEISQMLAKISEEILELTRRLKPINNNPVNIRSNIQMRDNEHIVPQEALRAMFVLTMDTEWELANPQGLYVSQNFLPGNFFDFLNSVNSKKKMFINLMKEKTDFSSKQIEEYYKIITTVGNIVLTKEFTSSELFHERIHKTITEELSNAELNRLIKGRTYFANEFHDEPMMKYALLSTYTRMSIFRGGWQEIYAYMAQYEKYPEIQTYNKYFDKEINDIFKSDYGKAYSIYKKVFELASL